MKKFYQAFYLSNVFYISASIISILFAVSFFFTPLFLVAKILLYTFCFFVLIDTLLLFYKPKINAERFLKNKFDNGIGNSIKITINNNYFFSIKGYLIEELPAKLIFANKNIFLFICKPLESENIVYEIKPIERGEYHFGNTLVFVASPISLVNRKYTFNTEVNISVYPSFSNLFKNTFQGVQSTNFWGNKKVRKLGNSQEFEQIKEYVKGDDIRTINWKATARRNQLMVNTYVDEKSQQVYCLIDKSRNMKMPFEGMSLLDYSINSCVQFSRTAISKHDKIGLISFSNKIDNFIAADNKLNQMELVLDVLYKQNTFFLDADYENVYATIRAKIKQRSLIILYTNFEGIHSLKRQLPYLKAINHYHLLCVVFFENTELKTLTESVATSTESVYINTIAQKTQYEKKLMLKELRHQGILSILTTPQNLSIDVVNKYIEIKSRQLL